ncbi:DnaJ (Hsp40), sub C, member 17 [Aphanomyces cochlioides]|nr:DnaJ (Hsp40), sub C, member 17 [Aphanomyces cochlioides]
MSLKRHPDRGGDVDKFHELQQASHFLLDPAKKKEYDDKISLKTLAEKMREVKNAQMKGMRKRVVDDLNRREDDAAAASAKKHKHERLLCRGQTTHGRYASGQGSSFERSSRLHICSRIDIGDIKQRTIRVIWSNSVESHSDETLVRAFRSYGDIENVTRMSNSAKIIFTEITAATQAVRIERFNSASGKK